MVGYGRIYILKVLDPTLISNEASYSRKENINIALYLFYLVDKGIMNVTSGK